MPETRFLSTGLALALVLTACGDMSESDFATALDDSASTTSEDTTFGGAPKSAPGSASLQDDATFYIRNVANRDVLGEAIYGLVTYWPREDIDRMDWHFRGTCGGRFNTCTGRFHTSRGSNKCLTRATQSGLKEVLIVGSCSSSASQLTMIPRGTDSASGGPKYSIKATPTHNQYLRDGARNQVIKFQSVNSANNSREHFVFEPAGNASCEAPIATRCTTEVGGVPAYECGGFDICGDRCPCTHGENPVKLEPFGRYYVRNVEYRDVLSVSIYGILTLEPRANLQRQQWWFSGEGGCSGDFCDGRLRTFVGGRSLCMGTLPSPYPQNILAATECYGDDDIIWRFKSTGKDGFTGAPEYNIRDAFSHNQTVRALGRGEPIRFHSDDNATDLVNKFIFERVN